MQLISTIRTPNNRQGVIELLLGDLSAIPREQAVDLLVVSAYPGDYTPVEGSLMGCLANKGLSLRELANHKKTDLRAQLGCWISRPLSKEQQDRLNIGSILCFEPDMKSNKPEEVVGNIFRCINSFAFDDEYNSIALPIVATGHQKIPLQTMLPVLLDAAYFWLQHGLPLDAIKLAIYSEDKLAIAKKLFEQAKRKYEQPKKGMVKKNLESFSTGESGPNRVGEDTPPFTTGRSGGTAVAPPKPSAAAPAATAPAPQGPPAVVNSTASYDFFISYAHKHTSLVNTFVEAMLNINPQLNIFYDRTSIPPGGLWIKQISDAIQKAKKVLVLLSPDYTNSPVCWDEFQCAKLIEYNNKTQVIQTVYLYNDAALPPIMGIYSWIDCREGDLQKLQQATGVLLN
jgi:hypothetical protein